MALSVGYPIDYSINGDHTNIAVKKHILEIEKIYGHLNDNIKELAETNEHFDQKTIELADMSREYLKMLKQYALASSESSKSAAGSAKTAWATEAKAYDNTKMYSFPDMVACPDGNTYRCIGVQITGEDPEISPYWKRVTIDLEDFWDIDMEGNLMPSLYPTYSNMFELDELRNITLKEG